MTRTPSRAAGLLSFVSVALASCAGVPGPNSGPTPTLEPLVHPEPTGWILVDTVRQGYWGIFLVNADGSGETAPLTVHPYGEYWSTWDPDGTRVAFSSFRDSAGFGTQSSIYTIKADGSGLGQLTDNTAKDRMPAWSPDGEAIAFSSDRDSGNFDIYVIGADGDGLRRVTQDPAADEWPAWSPDGRSIAFQSDRNGSGQVYVMRADGTGATQLTHASGPWLGVSTKDEEEGIFVDQVIDGSPAAREGVRQGDLLRAIDGVALPDLVRLHRQLLSHQPGDKISLTVMRGGTSQEITVELGTQELPSAQPAWSPDGRSIAFVSDRDGDWDIYVMNIDGSGEMTLTHNDVADVFPKWSPDGAHLAFASERDGNLDIYMTDADGTNEFRLTSDPSPEYPQSWAPAQAAVRQEPRFGPPFCGRDTDGDGVFDTPARQLHASDDFFFVGVPFANMGQGIPWGITVIREDGKRKNQSEVWSYDEGPILVYPFRNFTGYAINEVGIRGVVTGPFKAGPLTIQLLLEGRVVQEIMCEVVER